MSDADAVPSSSLDAPGVEGPSQPQQPQEEAETKKLTSPPLFPPPPDSSRAKLDGENDADQDEVLSTKADSEAETIIQSGRESLSPEKRKKHIQHLPRETVDKAIDHEDPSVDMDASPGTKKRKRSQDDSPDGSQPAPKFSPRSRRSSLASVVKKEGPEAQPSLSRRDSMHSMTTADQAVNGDLHARKRSSSEGVIEGDLSDNEVRPDSRQRSNSTRDRERREKTHPTPSSRSKDGSLSPPYRSHKRAASGPQQGAVENLQHKRRLPASLTSHHRQSSEDRQSVSSSASASPRPSNHTRRLTSSEGAAAAPAKMANHKKQRDQNGRTRLARACAAQEYDAAVARHAERPEDLNVADNAGNTPLQIASLEGCAPIVKFLLDAGCEIDTKNIDKDTPLIDAVENGHLEVIKLLLDAGANPRTVNAEGDEPYDLVPSDSEDYEEIRRIIAQAKANPPRKRPSEDNGVRSVSAKATSAASPRDSPPAHAMMSPPPGTSTATRRKTVRSEATRNDLLWTKPTPENLCNFAAKGDMAGVANVLNVIQKADAESLIAAAKGGHEDVMSLLLGMGDADPDPEPVQNPSCRPGYNTPMLAAIGRGSLAIIRLLLDQPGFNPTRRLYRGYTYYELAEDRKGENWEEEAALLKKAYEQFKNVKKMRKTETKSPKRSRDQEKDSARKSRRESSSPVAATRRPVRSPKSSRIMDGTAKENIKTRDTSLHRKEKATGNVRPKTTFRDDHSEHSADPDHPKLKKSTSERRQSDNSSVNRGEEPLKRRRLIAGRPPQDRDRRRPSLMSTDSLSGRDEFIKGHSKEISEAKDAQKAKLKRPRNSISPERSRSRGSENGRDSEEFQKKKRRLQSEDNSHKIPNGVQSVQKKSREAPFSKEQHPLPTDANMTQKDTPSEKHSVRPVEAPVPVKEEQKKQDTQELDQIPMEEPPKNETGPAAEEKEEVKRNSDVQMAQEAQDAEEQQQIAEELESARIAREEEGSRKAAEQARIAREKAEEEERKRKEAEQRRIRLAEEERQRRAEQERARIAKLRKEQEEQEQRRRDALPNRLRVAANLVGANDPIAKSHFWLKQFMPVVTARTRQLDPSCGPEVADELWVPNFLVAPLLATNDLQLSQYSSWEKRDATYTQRLNLWRVTRRILVQTDDLDAGGCSFGQVIQRDGETRPKYFNMEHIFWVKLSDFMDLVPHIPHLNGLEIEFLKMHIDQEPSFPLTNHFPGPQVNGNAFFPTDHREPAGSVNGLTNGYGHAHHSTYV